MTPIPLPSQDTLTELFEYSVITGDLYEKTDRSNNRGPRPIGSIATFPNAAGRPKIKISKVTYYAHRIIWRLVTGEDPQDLQIDHADGDRTNNAWHNLRIATHGQNIGHQRPHRDSQTGFRGVRLLPNGRYQSRIYHQGRGEALGVFDTPQEASAAYAKREQELRGEFTTISNY